MIGTPFMSKDIKEQRKIAKMNKKPWQHEVRDDKGRRRFHGAFTGGFSAGYYNTVGSKEGWKPKERYENGLKQNVVDFMDEEDIKDIYKEGCCYGKVSNDDNKVDMNKENDIFDYLLKDNTNNDRRFNALQKELMINAGFDVWSTDLINRGYGQCGVDFLTCFSKGGKWIGDILTNPPYKYAKEFVEKAMQLVEDGSYVVMFLKIQFLEGKTRLKMFKKYPPKYVYVNSARQICYINGDMSKKMSSASCYCWFVWEKGFEGEPQIRWI